MPTSRQLCSDVAEFLKINNVDERISYRYILSELRNAADNFIKQDADNRRIFKQTSLWKTIPCGIELEEISLIDCNFDVQDCRKIMRSKEKLPKTYSTMYGNLINISNIDGFGTYTQIAPTGYQEQKNRRYINKNDSYFWIIDDYLFIPDRYVEAVRGVGFFKTDDYLTFCKCGTSTNCIKPLDMEFNCPDYLIDVVKKEVKQALLTSFQRPQDEKPNLNSNEKQ